MQLVAQPCGFLEFEVGGCLAHALVEFLQIGFQVVADEVRVVLVAGLDGKRILRIDAFQDVADILAHAFGRDAVGGVIGLLLFAPAVGFVHRVLQRVRHLVGVEDDPAFEVAGGAADGLDQGRFRAQEAFLVGVQDRDQRAFGNVEPLAQQVDADQHVERTEAQIANDLDAFQGVDIRMQVAHADAGFLHVFGEVFGHALGQRGHQHALVLRRAFAGLVQQVVDLVGDRADDADRVDQPGGADDLFDEHAAGLFHFPRTRRRGDMHRLRAHGFPFLELERAIVDAGRQAKTEFGEGRFAVEVAFEHAADLRHRHVGLVDDQQRVVRDVLEQGRRRFARAAPGQVARIVLDARTMPRGFEHLDVEHCTLFQPLGLQQLVIRLEPRETVFQFGFYLADRLLHGGARRDVMRIRIDGDLVELARAFAGQRVEFVNFLDLVAEERQPPGTVLVMGGENLHRIAAHPEGAADKVLVVAAILQRHEFLQQV